MLNNQKYDINLIVTGKGGDLGKHLPEYINVCFLESSHTLFSLLKVNKIVNKSKPDIVIATSYMVNLVIMLVRVLFKSTGKSSIWLREPNTPGKSIALFHKFLLKRLYKYADCILAQTPEMKEHIRKFYKVSSSKVQVLYNPLDVDFLNKNLQNKDNPFDHDFVNLVAIGRLTRQKNFNWLIRVFQLLMTKSENYRLYIIGDGPDRTKLHKEIMNNELNHNIFLLGEKTNPYIYLRFADLLVSSSLWEGMPNVVLESIILGTPVVAMESTPYLNNIIKEPVNGRVLKEFSIEKMVESILNYRKYCIDSNLLQFHLKKHDWIEEIEN